MPPNHRRRQGGGPPLPPDSNDSNDSSSGMGRICLAPYNFTGADETQTRRKAGTEPPGGNGGYGGPPGTEPERQAIAVTAGVWTGKRVGGGSVVRRGGGY